MKSKILFTFICFAVVSNAFAQLGVYSFTNVTTTSGTTDPTTPPTAAGLTFGSFSYTGPSTNPNATGRFSFTNWPLGATDADDNYAGMTGSLNSANYYEVTLTPGSGFALALDSITFRIRRSGTGIRTYSVRSSLDSYANNLTAAITPTNANLSVQSGNTFLWNFDITSPTADQIGSRINLGAAFSSLNSAVTFRFFGWNAESTGGTFSIDDVKFIGTATQLQISASYTANTVCQGTATSFTENSTTLSPPITNWFWDFGDTQTASFTTQTNPTHTYTTCGNFNVKLKVTNAGSATDSVTQVVTVNCFPTATVTPAGPTSFCGGGSVVLNANTGTGLTYQWMKDAVDVGGATNSSYTATTAGNYAVKVTSAGCTIPSTSTAVTINPSPVPNFSSTAVVGDVTFTNSSTGGATYVWNFGDGSPTSSLLNPTHSFLTNGVKNVCLKVTAANTCADSVCKPITILGLGIEPILNSTLFLSVSPNPTRGSVTVDITDINSENSAIKVFTIIGKEIEHLNINQIGQGLFNIDLSSQVDGFYFVRVYTLRDVYTWRVALSR